MFENSRVKLIPAPTVMKNSPSSSPLKGFKSDSSSCLNSLEARTTPARNAPNAGDRPTSIIRNEMLTIISRARAVYISRRCAAWINRNTGRVRKIPAKMIAATAPMVTSVTPQAGKPSTRLMVLCPSPWAASLTRCSAPFSETVTGSVTISSGKNAKIGITAMSCVSSTENTDRPPVVCISPFSFSVCNTIAVELSDSVRPIAKDVPQGCP